MIRAGLRHGVAVALALTMFGGVRPQARAADATSLAADGGSERRARRHLSHAESHFRAGRFYEALIEYEAGYQEAPLAGFLINIAQCYRRLGDLPHARKTYQKFVLVASGSPLLAEVRGLIRELDELMKDIGEPPVVAVPDPPPIPAPPLPLAPAVAAFPLVLTPPLDTKVVANAPAVQPDPVRWGLWTSVGVVALGGAVASFFLISAPRTQTVHDGSLGSLRR